MKKSNVIGIDLAKNVIQVCTVSKDGEIISNKPVTLSKLKAILSKVQPSIVAMEGCSACHYWGRLAESYGHTVRIISPRKVKAFLQGQKTDANDALAIAVAAVQVGMVFSQLKTVEQQTLQTLESSRKLLVKERKSIMNHIRAYLYEYGITSSRGRIAFNKLVIGVLD